MWLWKIPQAVACHVPVQPVAPLLGRPRSVCKWDLYSSLPSAQSSLQGEPLRSCADSKYRGMPVFIQWGLFACFLSFPLNHYSLAASKLWCLRIVKKINHRLSKFCLYTLQCEPIIKELSIFTSEYVFADRGRGGRQTLNRPSIFLTKHTELPCFK